MKVEVVGTSCTWFERLNTSFIIDDEILFDVPAGNYKQIIKSIDIFKLKWIFISHFHLDHIGDLKNITTRYIRERDKRGNLGKLKIYAPAGLAELLIKENELFFGSDDEKSMDILKSVIEFIDVYDGMEFEENGYKLKVFEMSHGGVLTFGLTFSDKNGKTVGFSADTNECLSLHKMLEMSDYAFVDMASIRPRVTHLCTDDFVKLSEKYKNCKMFPVHTSDECQKFAEDNGLNYLTDGQVLNL